MFQAELGNLLCRNTNILSEMNKIPWPTAGLACASEISGLVIDLCGKARGANWINKDFFLVQLNLLAISLSTSTDFFNCSM